MAKASITERLELAKKARLCFSCLNRGHAKKDCRSKRKCEKSESCPFFHHPLLHSSPTNPPPVGNISPLTAVQSGSTSVLDKTSMMPIVRARFRAPNGRIREGNVLIDSGAGTTIIRKQFAKDLGLNGKRERIDLAVVGGETLEQPHSRRMNFWISAIGGDQEFKIEAYEIEKTILNVPDLDRKWLSSFPYLRDIELHRGSGPVDLILGVHYTHLFMLKMAGENESKCPRAATILRRDRYVDDLIHSCPNTYEAAKSMKEVDEVLATGSFKVKEDRSRILWISCELGWRRRNQDPWGGLELKKRCDWIRIERSQV